MNSLKYLKIIIKDELKAIRDQFRESKVLLIAFITCLIGILVYLQPFHDNHISIATSYKDSDWYNFGKASADYLAKKGLTTAVDTTDGAIENINRLHDPKDPVNAAFTYGAALDENQTKGIASLGSVSYDPVWIFYNKKNIKQLDNLHELARYRVAMGPINSGSYAISKKLLSIVDIDVQNNEHFIPDSFRNSEARFLAGGADVFMLVSTVQDPIIQSLMVNPDVGLYSFANAAAFEKKFNSFEALKLPAGSINIYKNIPARDISLIATTTSLVIKEDMHPDLQLALLMAVKELNRNSVNLFFAKRNEFPTYMDPRIPISPIAAKFYDYGPPHAMRYLPFWLAGFIDRAWLLLLTLVAVFYPLSKLNLHIRKLRFVVNERPHYEELLEIDKLMSLKKLSEGEKLEILERLESINRSAVEADVPVGQEAHYFELLNAIYLLRRKLEIN